MHISVYPSKVRSLAHIANGLQWFACVWEYCWVCSDVWGTFKPTSYTFNESWSKLVVHLFTVATAVK